MKVKTLLCLALVTSTLLGVFMIGPVGAQPTTFGVEPSSIVDPDLGPGSAFTVEIWIRNVTDLQILEFHLGYDTAVLTATLIEYGGIYGANKFEWGKKINDDLGWLAYAVGISFGDPNFDGDGRAAIIHFTVDSVGDSALDLYDTALRDGEGQLIVHTVIDGYFSNVGAVVGWLEGNVTDADTLLPIMGATVSANGISDTTDASGYYRIEVPAPGTYDVTAEMTGYVSQTVTDVSVSADETVVQDFGIALIVLDGWIEGNVTDADTALPVEGATVTADGYSDTTDTLGDYSIGVPAPETYDVTAKMTGYVSQTVTDVSVAADATVVQNFALSPAPLTTIGVEPPSIVDPGLGPGSAFTVEIWIRNVEDLKGLEFRVGYDTSVLTATLIEYGGIFGPNYSLLGSDIYDAEGWLRYGIVESPGEPTFYGDGRAAIIHFTPDSWGGCVLDLYDTNLGAPPDPVFPKPIPHEALDGYFSNVEELHDIEVIGVTATPTDVTVGETVSITATVRNQGTSNETFDVSVYYDMVLIGTITGVDLTIFARTTTLGFAWDTTGVAEGIYTIRAEASIVAGEDDTADNTFTDGQVTVSAPPPPTTIGVEPASILDTGLVPGSAFTVEVWIRNVEDLDGLQFYLGYDTAALTATLIEYGGIFPVYMEWGKEIHEAEGWLLYAVTVGIGQPGFYGDGCAAIIHFTVDSVGDSALDLYDTILGRIDPSDPLNPIPIPHEALEGYFSNIQPPPPEALEELIETMETWNLPKGTESSLTSKLEGALHLLDIGNENGAVHKLMTFISQVEAQRDKKLTDEQADQLVAEAQTIIDLIKG